MLNIALLQMAANGNDIEANRLKGDDFCRRAAALGADIALFPEMWSAGYTPAQPCLSESIEDDLWRAEQYWQLGGSDPEALAIEQLQKVWTGLAIGKDHPFILHFRALARELGMAIAITYLEEWEPLPRNTMSLIDRHGDIVTTYAKVHTCDFSRNEAALTPGDGFRTCTLDTGEGPVRVGAMICYDREFPESARVLMLQGAEIILTPNACDLEINRLAGFRTRACENMVGVALANYAGPELGHSVAYDGIAFANGRSRDMLVIEAGHDEGVYLAPFDLEALREYRAREAWGNAFRRPHHYTLLTTPEVAEPFVRVNSGGEAHHATRRTVSGSAPFD